MSVTHFTFPAIILKWNQPVHTENFKVENRGGHREVKAEEKWHLENTFT